MEFIKPKVEWAMQEPTKAAMFKQIEMVGRVCYHSEDKITTDSWEAFLAHQIEMHHMSPLEAGTCYLIISIDDNGEEYVNFFQDNTYSYVVRDTDKHCAYITTNYRVLVENELEYLVNEAWGYTEFHIPRLCFKFETCIEVYKDITRHRSLSPMEESIRFCNYNRGRFSYSVKFTLPCWLGYKSGKVEEETQWAREQLQVIESIYKEAQDLWGWDAQRASYFLPQGTHATCFFTGFVQDWEWFAKLRYEEFSGPVRPDVKEISTQVVHILKERGYYE